MQQTIQNPLRFFCKLLPIYWLCWWLSALWTDVTGALKAIGWLHVDWAFASNYEFLAKSLQIYSVPYWLPGFFLICIIIWLAIIVACFTAACYQMLIHGEHWVRWVQWAFIVSLLLWMAFFIADQMVMKFDLEENHMVQAGMEFLCFWFFCWCDENGII